MSCDCVCDRNGYGEVICKKKKKNVEPLCKNKVGNNILL